ncbi:ribonuclease H [Trifolium pratense]|uniref:Ribonuclease H n=1 Tax=Trifolium pratense TaxID=57577 RepID=A0A2K3NR17_TRIPR|nr:ribonuclease H [Trifolium pratense]
MSFRFFKAWTRHDDCSRVVKEIWGQPVIGNPMVRLQLKLKRLKSALKTRNKTVFEELQQLDYKAQLILTNALLNQDQFLAFHASTSHCTVISIVRDIIPQLVTNEDNVMLTKVPSNEEIKAEVFAMNSDGAPGPDGFGGHFYQFFWEVVVLDVIQLVQYFFTSGKLNSNLNANLMILILKTPEAINVLSKKCFAGNIVMKIDIKKAFDTLDLSFLLQVLKQFDFHATFCNWIVDILYSAKLSILSSGKAIGYFSCIRGVRQGDPLSPLLFYLAEEVLSRSLSTAYSAGSINPMRFCRGVVIPSHVLYADDILIFCQGSKRNIREDVQYLWGSLKPSTFKP